MVGISDARTGTNSCHPRRGIEYDSTCPCVFPMSYSAGTLQRCGVLHRSHSTYYH
jgi:hypothetical protein